MKKRVFSLVLIALLFIQLMPVYAISNNDLTSSGTTGDCNWALYGTTLLISGIGEMDDYSSVKYLDGWKTTAPWGTSITDVTIGYGVTKIGESSFSGCSKLNCVNIPDSVITIGAEAFAYCVSLDNIEIPNSVSDIGLCAFYNCLSIDNIELKSDVSEVSESLFEGCQRLKSIILPNSVNKIGNSAFANCDNLTSIKLPDNVESIGYKAFYGCDSLSRIIIGKALKSIMNSAFYQCNQLSQVYYQGTEDDWWEISIGYQNDTLKNSRITYNCGDFVLVTGLELDKNVVDVRIQEKSIVLTPIITPINATDKSILWHSQTPEIASVSGGVVSFLSTGTAIIFAISNDGGFVAYCSINIECSHPEIVVIDEKPSSCIEKGHTAYTICKDCGTIIEGSNDELPLTDHKETEIRYSKEATCCEDGYTGDKYCKECSTVIEIGSVIPATVNHADVDGKWETDDSEHWHTCYYGTRFDVSAHTGGAGTCTEKAKCSVCGVEYSGYGAHGETEIRDAKEATCCENGYTGDTYCKDCNAKIASGSVIHATGNHTDADGKWETNGTQHWHTCYYGTQFDIALHNGGTATCTEKARCSICGAEYGEYGVHKLTHHDRVEPDYENDGNIEYWICDECGKYFSDSEGNNEISADDIVIAKLVVFEYQFIDGEVIIEAPAGAIPEGSMFDVQKIVPPPAEVVEKVKEQMGTSSEVLAYYEIRLSDAGGTLIIHLDGEITIKTKMPEQYIGSKCVRILQEDETGKLIVMESWWENDYLCYKTDWLEIYN